MKNYKAAIFDLDGTLINSLEDIADSINAMLTECGYPTHTYEQYKFLVGNGFRTLVTRCLPEKARSEENIERCQAIGMRIYQSRCTNKSHLYDGVAEMLDLISGKGLSLAILSNKPDELTQKTVAALLSRWKFEVIMGASELFPRKPDPESALHIAKTLGVIPSEVLYLGDSDVDMKTANAAGFYAIGVSWGFRPRAELAASGAKLIIDTPHDLVL